MKPIIILIAIAVGIGSYFFLQNKNAKTISSISDIIRIPTKTPFLFEEITIPYLREKEFNSALGELDPYSTNENFETFLTSYTSDGLKINGLLTIPKGERPTGGFPAIVFVHGYIAPTIYSTTERYTDYVNYLARNGFVVFKIDLRGHGQSEGEAGGSYYSSDYIIDTLNAYSALQNSDFVNPEKIGLWGHSMAGNVTFRSMAVKKDIPAIVVWSGAGYTYEDLQAYRIMDNSYRPPSQSTERARKRQLLNDTYGAFSPESDFWKKVPATNYLDGVTTAVEVHHAVDDNVVSIEYARNLMNVLENTAIPHTLYEYQSGGHNITGSAFTQAMQRTVEFFKENLQ